MYSSWGFKPTNVPGAAPHFLLIRLYHHNPTTFVAWYLRLAMVLPFKLNVCWFTHLTIDIS